MFETEVYKNCYPFSRESLLDFEVYFVFPMLRILVTISILKREENLCQTEL